MGVLDDMTKGITERKAKAAGPKLTPVGVEASPTKPSVRGIPDVPEVFLTNEAVSDVAKDLRRQAALLIEVADALDARTGTTSDAAWDAKAAAQEATKREEREADARIAAQQAEKAETLPELTVDVDSVEDFKERLDKLSAEAIASLDEVLPQPEKAAGWTCPDHGAATLKQLESRKGRRYMACQTAGCREFEKE